MEHLWTGEPPPPEYIRLVMCRDVYHCTPLEFERIPWWIIRQDLQMMSIERDMQRRRERT